MTTEKKIAVRLRRHPPRDPESIYSDVQHIIKALYDAGYVVTYRAAKVAWEQYSADEFMKWMPVARGSKDAARIVEILLRGLSNGEPYLVDNNTGEEVRR